MIGKSPADIGAVALDALFPRQCLHCHLPTARDLDLCTGCETDLPVTGAACRICAEPLSVSGICGHCLKSPPDFSRVIAPFSYSSPVSGWINRFKRYGDLRTGQVLGELLAGHINRLSGDIHRPDCLVPIPLHWRRRFTRGFNQSAELARIVARRTGLPLDHRLMKRARHTGPQTALDRNERLKNLRRAFTADTRCGGLSIAVVDDVVTTGATARMVASALARAGAADVQIWAVARTALEN